MTICSTILQCLNFKFEEEFNKTYVIVGEVDNIPSTLLRNSLVPSSGDHRDISKPWQIYPWQGHNGPKEILLCSFD